jgi:hypothetical protein
VQSVAARPVAMDTDTLKALFPLLGGALALAGGVFTFVSGRLKEAEGPDAKDRVVGLTLTWISLALNAFALLAAVVLGGYAVSVILFCCAFFVQVVIFLRKSEPVRRIDVVVFSFMCSFFGFFLASVVTLYYIGRLLDLVKQLIHA